LINSPLVQIQAADNTRGVGNKNWVLKAISDTIMVLPPLAEQHRIVEKLEQVLGEIDKLKK
jgi:type I restriction enzyme S subunit